MSASSVVDSDTSPTKVFLPVESEAERAYGEHKGTERALMQIEARQSSTPLSFSDRDTALSSKRVTKRNHKAGKERPGTPAESGQWTLFGRKTQQSKVVFFSQVIILYIIIITCLVNITVESKNFNLWSTLLASSIGYLLPCPKLKDRKGSHD